MYKFWLLLLISIFMMVAPTLASVSERLEVSSVLKSRKVIGVIYFKKNSVKLSKTQKTELERIASLIVSQYSPDKIVRVEGFAIKHDRRNDSLTTSLARAKSVWYYFEKMDSFTSNRSNLYLTGFSAQQSISNLQGERVEIAIYENPFNEKVDSYSSN